MSVSYPRDMRERAKQDGKTLASVDTDIDGCRFTTQGPATKQQARFLLWMGIASTILSEHQLDTLRRDVKKKIDRKNQKRHRDIGKPS